TPNRSRLRIDEWFPLRYLASYTWPVPSQRVQHRSDGVTYYYKSRNVDEPLIATLSGEGGWVASTFSRDAGNVWTNPALFCQHADPQKPLAAGQKITLEEKLLMLRGGLEDVQKKFVQQRALLK
ncbi:MAG TPA: hypothetical protein VF836_06765, partial [Gemmatimonadaceae bacterium]